MLFLSNLGEPSEASVSGAQHSAPRSGCASETGYRRRTGTAAPSEAPNVAGGTIEVKPESVPLDGTMLDEVAASQHSPALTEKVFPATSARAGKCLPE